MAKLGAFITGLFMGGLAGAAIGVLTAPKSGSQLREDLVDASENLYRKAAYELEELSEKVEELKTKIDLEDFSPAKVEKTIEQAQQAMQQTQTTTIESQQLLNKTP